MKNIEIIYNFLYEIKKPISFYNIWKKMFVKLNKDKTQSEKEQLATLYSDMVLDHRFILTKDGMWTLRKFIKYEKILKDYTYDQFENTEEFNNIEYQTSKKK